MLGKGVHLYEYMDSWKSFDETWLPEKEDFYRFLHLNMKDITDTNYNHAKRMWKGFEIKNLGEYHDLYVHSDTLLIADVLENFRNKYTEMYELDSAHFLPESGWAWQAGLKNTEVELELLTDIDMLLMIEKGIIGGMSCNTSICNSKK